MRACAIGAVLWMISGCAPSETESDIFIPSTAGETRLHYAAKTGDEDAVREILSSGADPNAMEDDGETPLHHAARADFTQPALIEITRLLLAAGADPNARSMTDETALHRAIHSANPQVVNMLLESGADPNAKNDLGWTPLHVLVLSNYPDVIVVAEQLVVAGANVNARDTDGRTPLDRAKKFNRLPIAKYLAEVGGK